ncbi:MAG: hypothetical protein IMW89_20345, partial [Ktedonobacteraceae bacterium]|nr:hypothetical protein [Ktedonobacteraceae bacterium]
MEQTFSPVQRVRITDMHGNVIVRGWEQQSIKVRSEKAIGRVRQESDTLILGDSSKLVEIQVPVETVIEANDISGDVTVEDVRQVMLHDISRNVTVKNVAGDVVVDDISARVAISGVRGTVSIGDVGAEVKVEQVDGDVRIADVG